VEHEQRVDNVAETARVEHAGRIAMVVVMPEPDLGKLHLGIHPRGWSEEPGAQPFAGPAGGGFVVIDLPSGGQGGNGADESEETAMVPLRD